MKKYVSVIAVFIALALSACAQKSTTTTKTISYMSMQRTACFGQCPMYMVEIYKNGLVRYTGRKFVKYEGVYERNIGSKKAQSLLKEFSKYRVDTCKDMYESNIADMPGLMFQFTINGKNKEIVNGHFGPQFLEELAGKLDKEKAIQPTSTWKKVKAGPKKDS